MKKLSSSITLLIIVVLTINTIVPRFFVSEISILDISTTESHSTVKMEKQEENIKFNVMHFSHSKFTAEEIYFECRRGVDIVAYFGVSEIYYGVGSVFFKLIFPGSQQVIPKGEEPTGSVTNYLIGNDPACWQTGLNDYAVLRYTDIYPGIDLVYKIFNGNLKYEFIVGPDTNPGIIQMCYPDSDIVKVRNDYVIISSPEFTFKDSGLWAFQEVGGIMDVVCKFKSQDKNTIGFEVGPYVKSQTLTIDPVLTTSTFFGGNGFDDSYGVALEDGYVYITGSTSSTNFPTYNAYNSTHGGNYDCFVAKFEDDGKTLVYSTFIGGQNDDFGQSIAVEDGYAYITGRTWSSTFPTENPLNATHGGNRDCFVTKLADDGQSLIYSTFLGGADDDYGEDIAVEEGYAYITGYTESTGFPVYNAYDSSHNGVTDCFVTKLAANGQSFIYSTFLGGTIGDYGESIAVEEGHAYITGQTLSTGFPTQLAYDGGHNGGSDCFLTKLGSSGTTLDYSTFLGGGLTDSAYGITVENGFVYLTGETWSSDFPTVNALNATYGGNRDCFVTKFATNGLSLVYSTYLGGENDDTGNDIAVEKGYAYIVGKTKSPSFPYIDAFDLSHNGYEDCFVTKLATSGQSFVYSTFIGGSSVDIGNSIAVEYGYAYITGYTSSANFPTKNAYNLTYGGFHDCFMSVLADDGDNDGLSDRDEDIFGTNPSCIDTDNDNFLDGYEVAYGSNPLDPMSYPVIPQAWYDAIYEDLDGNTTLIQNLIAWSNGNATLLETVIQQLNVNTTLLQHVVSWLDGNHTAIETLFTFVEGNATLLMETVDAINGNSSQLILLAALISQNTDVLSNLNATHIGDINEIREVLDMLGVTVGDTDYDGLDDLDEINLGTDIQCIDTDTDNLNDAFEVKIGTDPTDDDSDGDTFYDGAEVLAGTDPLNASDYPGSTTPTQTTTPILSIELLIGIIGFAGIIVLIIIIRRIKGVKESA